MTPDQLLQCIEEAHQVLNKEQQLKVKIYIEDNYVQKTEGKTAVGEEKYSTIHTNKIPQHFHTHQCYKQIEEREKERQDNIDSLNN